MSTYRFRSEKFLSRKFKDLAISFDDTPNTNDFATVTNENAIKQSVRNLILTTFGERPFQPKTGSRVKSMLFENFDVFMIEGLTDEIRNTLKRLEPRVAVNDVRCSVDDTNELAVEIDYTIIGEQLVYTVDFLLEKA